ncbi:MAG: nucleoside 2-deoxyribosyltransferase [Anaerolineae bacterium]|nr:nucleoside 2-deoxyribosyltransferase [Anaerolineae bacterium]MDK1081404.1 nucleoside 2-deoxyribosyltransferase [Anaerolineae bacterium]MDK1118966.1 nucleoside 2-deoxyribosyltransferase [Anaerolineae bacterium]
MNIYFACSITGGRAYESIYQEITAALLEDGHEVPTAHLAESNVLALEKVVDARVVFERDVAWISTCDAVLAEVSVPSHGVGYEIGIALEQGKTVLCLAKDGIPVSKMITGNPHPNLRVIIYKEVSEGITEMRKQLEKKPVRSNHKLGK